MAFLCSTEASLVNGANITVDGGQSRSLLSVSIADCQKAQAPLAVGAQTKPGERLSREG